MSEFADAKTTREFAIRNIITAHTGKRLTPDVVDQIVKKISDEMQSGSTAWAFLSELPLRKGPSA
jgi:hypothetical protein